ncbi:MAG: hypothetical protein ACR2PH_08675 [Desulfobulbia bacterium]
MAKLPLSVITAEKQFAAIQKKHKNTLNEMDIAQQEKAENIERQRALRLAKEAAERKRAVAQLGKIKQQNKRKLQSDRST